MTTDVSSEQLAHEQPHVLDTSLFVMISPTEDDLLEENWSDAVDYTYELSFSSNVQRSGAELRNMGQLITFTVSVNRSTVKPYYDYYTYFHEVTLTDNYDDIYNSYCVGLAQ